MSRDALPTKSLSTTPRHGFKAVRRAFQKLPRIWLKRFQMVQAIALLKARDPRETVPILNPRPAEKTRLRVKRAMELIERGRAEFVNGFIVFPAQQISGRNGRTGLPLVRYRFSGADARPERPVLPPSAEVLSRFGSSRGAYRGPLRPPVKGAA